MTAVVEGGSAPRPMPLAADKAAAEELGSTPVEGGESAVSATVSVTFSIT